MVFCSHQLFFGIWCNGMGDDLSINHSLKIILLLHNPSPSLLKRRLHPCLALKTRGTGVTVNCSEACEYHQNKTRGTEVMMTGKTTNKNPDLDWIWAWHYVVFRLLIKTSLFDSASTGRGEVCPTAFTELSDLTHGIRLSRAILLFQ